MKRRSVALEGGSNFRDLGGYPAADRRTTRWHYMFRSGALGQLTDSDIATLDGLGVSAVLDLRCREESELTPTRWAGAELHSIDYPTEAVFEKALGSEALDLYESFPQLLGPHLAWAFERLLYGDGPIVMHCSGGQDRTGVVSGIVLAALGVPTEQIVEDYMLTTSLRVRKNEIDFERVAQMEGENSVAAFFARIVRESGTEALDPKPLLDSHGRPKLLLAFDAIDRHWGGMREYLEQVCDLDDARLTALRAACLE